jgi:hypothetical protein
MADDLDHFVDEDYYDDDDTTTTTTTNNNNTSKKKENLEIITDSEWDTFLAVLMNFLTHYENTIDVMDFLGQVKNKNQDCSRCYTGMWTLDMLHNLVQDKGDKLNADFKANLTQVQRVWSTIMERVRPLRKNLMGRKCIEFFYAKYSEASNVATPDEVEKLADNDGDRWYLLSKLCHDKGLNDDKVYQDFIAKLMVEMVKY